MSPPSLALPFVVQEKESDKLFTSNMEVATILAFSEARRRRRGLFETKPKRTLFVSKLYYPLWSIPWEDRSLVLDGLGTTSVHIEVKLLPNVTNFIDDIERGTISRQDFSTALDAHEATFKTFPETVQLQVDSLIANSEMMSAILEHLRNVNSQESMGNDTIFVVPPELDSQRALEIANNLPRLQKQIQSEIRSLEYARNLLEETAKIHEEMILKEVESTREAYEAGIAELQPAIDKKVDQLMTDRDVRLDKMRKASEKEQKAKERELGKQERKLQRLELEKASLLNRLESRKRRHDKTGATHWERRIRDKENKIKDVKPGVHAISESVERIRKQNEADIEKLRHGYQTLIDQEKRKIADIEDQRDRRIEAKRYELDTIRLKTARISNAVSDLIEKKRIEEVGLKKLTIQWQFEDATFLCLPFYLAGYEVEDKTEFQIFPPLKLLSSQGILKNLRKTIMTLRAASSLKLFLKPSSKAMSRFLRSVLNERLESDKAFKESLLKATAATNILGWDRLKETLTIGIEQLKTEGWVSQKEAQTLINAYS